MSMRFVDDSSLGGEVAKFLGRISSDRVISSLRESKLPRPEVLRRAAAASAYITKI